MNTQSRLGLRALAIALLATAGACNGMTMSCPMGTELMGDRCVAIGTDSGQPTMDGGMLPAEDGGEDGGQDASAFDAGTLPTMPDAGPMMMPDAGPMMMPDAGPGLPDGGCNDTFSHIAFFDGDHDGHGNPAISVDACPTPSGFVSSDDDCNDSCPTCFPGATEICDGLDNDCDGVVDNGVLMTFHADADGDGHGNPAVSMSACSAPAGYVASADDCNDSCNVCYPGRPEACDGLDNDCNGVVDNGVLVTFYQDSDGDGYGTSVTTQACSRPSGYATRGGDCDDTNAMRHPGATEVCDGVDNNCSGAADETFACVRGSATTCTTTCGSTGSGLCSGTCTLPTGAACNPPVESCNQVDDNCDGRIDEGVITAGPTITSSAIGDAYRPHVAMDGANIYSFWAVGTNVYGWSHDTSGRIGSLAEVPMLTGTPIFDIDARGGAVLYATANTAGTGVSVSWLDPATLTRTGGTYTIAPGGTVGSVRVSLSSDGTSAQVYMAVTLTGATGSILMRYPVTRTGGVGTVTWVATPVDSAFDVAHYGSQDYIAVNSSGLTIYDVDVVAGTTAIKHIGTGVAAADIVDPSIAVDSGGGILFVWGTRGVAAGDSISAGYLSSWSATAITQTLSAPSTTTASMSAVNRAVSMTDISFGGGVFAVAAMETPDPGSSIAYPNIYHVRVSGGAISHFAISPGFTLGFSTDQGLPILRGGAGTMDLMFFNPSTDEIAVRPFGCY